MTVVWLSLAVVATLGAAIVAGFENGVYALSHIRLRYRLSMGDPRAKVVNRLLLEPRRLISGILLTQNAAVYFTTAVVTSLFQEWGIKRAEILSTLALAVCFFIVVEAVPKNVFRRAADTLVYLLARPMTFALRVLDPAVFLLRGVTSLVMRIGRQRGETFDPLFTRDRLAFYLQEGRSEGVLSEYQVELAHNILLGERVTVGRAMVPLEEVTSVPADASVEEFAQISRDNRFSRYPVYRGARDNVVGIVNIYDGLLNGASPSGLDGLIRSAAFFSPDVHVTEALRSMREARQTMGIVAADGRALGIVTLKDCMEEIVGELYAW